MIPAKIFFFKEIILAWKKNGGHYHLLYVGRIRVHYINLDLAKRQDKENMQKIMIIRKVSGGEMTGRGSPIGEIFCQGIVWSRKCLSGGVCRITVLQSLKLIMK